jgi:predicted nucleotidyltransferase component of viral defense system
MNLFDQLVDEALKNQPSLSSLRIVVEKELLHHDILRTLSQNQLLNDLTFIGGTCLRSCYGGIRLSEDLDFTGGRDFSRQSLSKMGQYLTETLSEKYGLQVIVGEPEKNTKNVDTWKIKIETRPRQRHLPAQRINIDICKIPSYERQPMMLINPYGTNMGTNGLILQAQSCEEIYTDKLLAFALRPNRIKYRDLWDIVWLHQQGFKPKLELIPQKLHDRSLTPTYFCELFDKRLHQLSQNHQLELEFKQEMRRFLSLEQIGKTVDQDNLWAFIIFLMKSFTIKH